jgi:3-isopropylmalate/(R)-2-methylmalate dehydratase small subunit
MRFSGKFLRFGHDINKDLIQPVPYIFMHEEVQARHVFSANRPGWADEVRSGDILVAGRNFGTGSGRPAARVLKDLGIACLLAESINGLFFRNCVNYGFPALEVPGVHDAFEEGDRAEIDFTAATATNRRTGKSFIGRRWPEPLYHILEKGGVLPLLEAEGLVEPARKGAEG